MIILQSAPTLGNDQRDTSSQKSSSIGSLGPTTAKLRDHTHRVTRRNLLEKPLSLKLIPDGKPQQVEFLWKLRLCATRFSFSDERRDTPDETLAKENKRLHLIDLTDHLAGNGWFNEESATYCMQMIAANIFRAFDVPNIVDVDQELNSHDDIPSYVGMCSEWPHLQMVYEFFLRLLRSAEVDTDTMAALISKRFIQSLIGLLKSNDPRERDYLKMLVHRMYGRFTSYRSFLRITFHNEFYQIIYPADIPRWGSYHGVSELLQILGSIISGFTVPLKDMHLTFLQRILLPLHKADGMFMYFLELEYCVCQFIEKDPSTLCMIVIGILKIWPLRSAKKKRCFVSELSQIMAVAEDEYLIQITSPLFNHIALLFESEDHKIVDSVLQFWKLENFISFISDHRSEVLPLIYPALLRASENHWNESVKSRMVAMVETYKKMDESLCDEILLWEEHQVHNKREEQEKRDDKWSSLRAECYAGSFAG